MTDDIVLSVNGKNKPLTEMKNMKNQEETLTNSPEWQRLVWYAYINASARHFFSRKYTDLHPVTNIGVSA